MKKIKQKDLSRLLKKMTFWENAKLKDVVEIMNLYLQKEGKNEIQ